MKIKYVLAAVQMAVATILLWWRELLEGIAARLCDSPGPNPAFDLSDSINGPLSVALRLLEGARFPWDLAMWVPAVGLFWYWAAVNVSSLRRGAGIVTVSWRPARLALDHLLMLTTLSLWSLGLFNGRMALHFVTLSCYGSSYFLGWPESMTVACLYLGWAAVLVYFCGRDFVQCLRSRRLK